MSLLHRETPPCWVSVPVQNGQASNSLYLTYFLHLDKGTKNSWHPRESGCQLKRLTARYMLTSQYISFRSGYRVPLPEPHSDDDRQCYR